MTVRFLASMLEPWVTVIIKDYKTRKEVYRGEAGLAAFNDRVVDWDFSRDHIIYI